MEQHVIVDQVTQFVKEYKDLCKKYGLALRAQDSNVWIELQPHPPINGYPLLCSLASVENFLKSIRET